MPIEYIFKGLLIGITVSAPLGPVALLVIQRTLNKGHLPGVASGVGAGLVDSFYAVVAGLGFSFISDFLLGQQVIFRITGGIILVSLGLNMFFKNPVAQIRKMKMKQQKPFQDFLTTALLTLSNPMTIAFFGAVFAALSLDVNAPQGLQDMQLLLVGVLTGTMLWWVSLTAILNHFRSKIRLRTIISLNKITSIVIVILGGAAAISVFTI
ncbi:MAG: LysE family transporter [Bacteroidales bacterium]|nr:LysE family transporter [Bacteroidales bacterium]